MALLNVEDPAAWHFSRADTLEEALMEFASAYFWPLLLGFLVCFVFSRLTWLTARFIAWWVVHDGWASLSVLLPFALYIGVIVGVTWIQPRLADPPDKKGERAEPFFHRRHGRGDEA